MVHAVRYLLIQPTKTTYRKKSNCVMNAVHHHTASIIIPHARLDAHLFFYSLFQLTYLHKESTKKQALSQTIEYHAQSSLVTQQYQTIYAAVKRSNRTLNCSLKAEGENKYKTEGEQHRQSQKKALIYILNCEK